MFDILLSVSQHVTVMMFKVELKKISGTPVSLLALSTPVSCWLASVHIVHHFITNVAQCTLLCEVTMQDFDTYINIQQCVVNIDETYTFFDMESRLTLATKGDKTVSLKTTETSMRCTILLGIILVGEKFTTLVVFKGQSNGRVARTFNGIPVSMKYICQEKAWVD